MYVFEDKRGRSLALRPEITAAVIRMYINEAKVAPKPLRWCYFADCFRYERPQKGRYRQFWQFGVELIGADTAQADAEVIALAADMLNATGVTYDLKVGHLVLAATRVAAERGIAEPPNILVQVQQQVPIYHSQAVIDAVRSGGQQFCVHRTTAAAETCRLYEPKTESEP